ncbi:dynamin family protein [Nonomuraea sp. NPDC002799]
MAPAARQLDEPSAAADADRSASAGPVDFFAARKKPDPTTDRAALRQPAAAPEEQPTFNGPSLFVKPAALGGQDDDQTSPTRAEQDDVAAPAEQAAPEEAAEPAAWNDVAADTGDEQPSSGEPSDEELPLDQEPEDAADSSDADEPVETAAPAVSEEPEAHEAAQAHEDADGLEDVAHEPGDDAYQSGDDAYESGEEPGTQAESHANEPGGAAESGGVAESGADESGGVAESGELRESRQKPPTRTEALPAEAAKALMAALDTLRESVADLRFGVDLPGAEEARQAQADLLTQLQDYVLPRVRTSAAPALIVIAGSTGAGKSTLVNSLAERNVSRTGVRRPTTGTPVLACHPDDRKWFMEGELLGGLERLEKPSPKAGMRSMVVIPTEKLPQGVALLDTPDIDSVVEEHHEIAHRMLDAADLWIFVTTAARYADAPAWNLLRLAKERGARLAIVLSRVPPKSAEVVLKHFVRMLTEYGLGDVDRFIINEAKVADGRLPDSEVTELRLWLAELSVDEGRRAQAVRETFNGVLNSFRTRVPALARHLEGQVAFRAELRSDVEAAFLGALAEIDKTSKNGSLLHGEVLARWQDFAGSGDLMRSLHLRKRGRAAKHAPERVTAFKGAIRTGLESVIVAAANRASEEVVARWRHRSELGAKLGEGLGRPSDDLVRYTGRAIASWQEHLSELVRTEGVAKRSVSKLVSFDPDSLSLIFTVAMFSGSNGEGVPHRLVNALLGAESLRGIGAKALSDLRARIGMLFDEESMRYVQALDSAGIPDESVATRLYQASYNLEVAR